MGWRQIAQVTVRPNGCCSRDAIRPDLLAVLVERHSAACEASLVTAGWDV